MTSRTPVSVPVRRGAGLETVASDRSSTRRQDTVTAAAIGALVVATWPLFHLPPGSPPLIPLIAHVAGMLAGYGVLLMILLVARTPVLEQDVGADVLARWHSRGGRLVLGLIVVHAWAATQGWAQSRGLSFPRSVIQVLELPWIPAATVGTVLMIVAAVLSARRVRRAIGHERWHGMHLLMYVAVALGFAHQLAGPDLVGHRFVQVGWALAYTHVFAVVVRYRVLLPMRRAARHRLRVTKIREEAPGVVSIVVVGQHLEELQAQPGQFFRWRFLTPDHWLTAHPFSLSAAPSPTQLRLTVKSLGDGSRSLQELPVGTWVVAEGPYGAITAARRSRRDVLLIAGGVGITPMRALFETLTIAPDGDLLLLYRARSADELLFRTELNTIARKRNARVKYLLGENRSILSAHALRQNIPNISERDVYMCGPSGLTAAVRTALRHLGLPAEQLHEERFEF